MNLFETGIRPLVDEWLLAKSKEVRSYGDYWSASSAGYCMRKQIFERLGVPKVVKEDDARKQRVFTAGHIFHEWIQGVTKEAGISIAQELELQDEGLMVRGHIDDLVSVDSMDFENVTYDEGTVGERTIAQPKKKLILYDYKTVNSRSFMWAKKRDNAMSHYHRMQLGTYMYMLNNLEAGDDIEGRWLEPSVLLNWSGVKEARILKIEKENLMMMEQQLMWSPELEKDVVGYWNTLNGYWNKKMIPKCTCADYEGGFMGLEKWNPYFKDGESCSIKIYEEWKDGHKQTKSAE